MLGKHGRNSLPLRACRTWQQDYALESRRTTVSRKHPSRLRSRAATQRSKKGSGKGSGEGFSEGFREGACCGFYSKKGSSEGVPRRGFPEGA